VKYVAGFLFTEDLQNVWLIQKEKPFWQRGMFNGIGGKVEPGETPYAAMVREFKEEAGLNLTGWREFVKLQFPDGEEDNGLGEVTFFECISDGVPMAMTKEEIFLVPVSEIFGTKWPVIDNLKYLVPMALNRNMRSGTLFEDYSIPDPERR